MSELLYKRDTTIDNVCDVCWSGKYDPATPEERKQSLSGAELLEEVKRRYSEKQAEEVAWYWVSWYAIEKELTPDDLEES